MEEADRLLQQALVDDAPLLVLLSLNDNPLLAFASDKMLGAVTLKLRVVAATPSKQASLLTTASGVKRKRENKLGAQKMAEALKRADED